MKSFRFFTYFFIPFILLFNLSLYYSPDFKKDGRGEFNVDVYHQLQHLKGVMRKGAAQDMQTLYPEGFIFQNSLYGLAWADFAAALPPESNYYKEAVSEIEWAIEENGSPLGKANYDEELSMSYGAYYMGWTTYLMGKRLHLGAHFSKDSILIESFKSNCRLMASAISTSQTPFMESYKRFSWPADMVLVIASLRLHDRIFPARYSVLIDQWLREVETKTDDFGLIPHSSDHKFGWPRESARGSSQSLILQFLYEIDPEYGRKKFEIYKEHFLTYRLGLPGVLESPKGNPPAEDVDSGPVIWGVGGAASIVGQRTFALYGEDDIAIGLRNSIETFGIGKTIGQKKNYLMGYLPMADVFIAWANSVEFDQVSALKEKSNWRLDFQLLSLTILLIFGLLLYFSKKKKIG